MRQPLDGTVAEPVTPRTGREREPGGDQPSSGRQTSWRRWRAGLVAADAVVIAAASGLAYVTREFLGAVGALPELAYEVPVAVAAIPVWLGVLAGLGNYRRSNLNAPGEGFRRFLAGTAGGVLALGFVSFAFNLQLSRGYVMLLALYALVFGLLVRSGLRAWLRSRWLAGRGLSRVLVVGVNDEARSLASALMTSPACGYEVVGFADESMPVGTDVVDGGQVLGSSRDVLAVAEEHDVGLVVASPSGLQPGTLHDITVRLEGSPVDFAVFPSLHEVATRRVEVESVANVPLMHVEQIRLERGKAALKRACDVVGAVGLLAVLWPLMLAAAVVVRLDSRGPALFKQQRVARDGRRFTLLKFRTMHDGADERRGEMGQLNEAGHHFFKIRQDPRVTRVGRHLRRWSIDETPQLWNVLKGDMALVGPRPALPEEVVKYEPWHERRLRVKPGVTGLWQVSGRADVPFDEAVRLDLFYIENWSLGFDLVVLGRTVLAVLGCRGAY